MALLRLKWSGEPPVGDVFQVPIWVPIMGLITSVMLLLAGLM
jgi:hypothetical protein